MTEKRVLVRDEDKKVGPVRADPVTAWRWLGWVGLLLWVVGMADFLLGWIPTRFGSPEWEFATIATTYSGLPLITMGFAGLLASAVALGNRRMMQVTGWGLIGFTALLLLGFLVFLLTIPVALNAASGIAAAGVKKAIVKTIVLTLAFSVAYAGSGWMALRQIKRSSGGTDAQ